MWISYRTGKAMSLAGLLEKCHALLEDFVAYVDEQEARDETLLRLHREAKRLCDQIAEIQARKSAQAQVIPSEMYAQFVSFVLGDAETALLRVVGEHGYGRLSDIERYSDVHIPQDPRKAWKRLHSLGLLYGKDYSYLTSRGASAYRILTGKNPVPAKKDGRKHIPSPSETCVHELGLKIRYRLPLSSGASLILKLLGNSRVYMVGHLATHPVCQSFFRHDGEFDRSLQELRRRNLLYLDDERIVLTPLGRLVWNLVFYDDRKHRDKSSHINPKWVDDIIAYFQQQGFRVKQRSEQNGFVLPNGRKIFLDLVLIRDRRIIGVLFPPMSDDPAARRWFLNMLTDVSNLFQEIYVVAPTTDALEYGKRSIFHWIAEKRGTLKSGFTIIFATHSSLREGKEEKLHVSPKTN